MACISGNCELTQSPNYKLVKALPLPTSEDMHSALFNQLWEAIKGKRLACPEYYTGWQIATGCHVKIIMEQIKEVES